MEGDDHKLLRAEPERPLALAVLHHECKEALNAAHDSTVDDDGTTESTSLVAVFEIEALRELEVELDGSELVHLAAAVFEVDVNLGTVEGTVAVSNLVVDLQLLEGVLKRSFGFIPTLVRAEEALRAGRNLEGGLGEAESAICFADEAESVEDLILDLVATAEDVTVILVELTAASKARECRVNLVPVACQSRIATG